MKVPRWRQTLDTVLTWLFFAAICVGLLWLGGKASGCADPTDPDAVVAPGTCPSAVGAEDTIYVPAAAKNGGTIYVPQVQRR